MKNKSCQTGMTFVEIMIALLMGSILLGGVLQVFLGSKQTFRMQQALSRLQENGRFALDFLAKDIRMAGFIECNSGATPDNKLNLSTDFFLYDLENPIEGFESTSKTAWSPAKNAAIPDPLGGSDIITIRRAGDDSFFVKHEFFTYPLTLDDAIATQTNLQATGYSNNKSTPANNCAIAVVSNCKTMKAAVFQVSKIIGLDLYHDKGGACKPGNKSNFNKFDLYNGGQVYSISTISFFIKNNPNNQPSLYRRVGLNDAEELIEGIENMQIVYGVGRGVLSRPGYYTTADKVDNNNDWPKVLSVSISLLAVSLDDNLTDQSVPYTFNNKVTMPNDRKIRRVFNTTIALRNRLL